MRALVKFLFFFIFWLGYVFNFYYLVADPVIKDYGFFNKVGIVVVPLGSIMGYVYFIDKKQLL